MNTEGTESKSRVSIKDQDTNGETRWVQSCITSVSFPSSLDKVLKMAKKHSYFQGRATDLDALLDFEPGTDLFWSAPKWLTTGDILFFYHTKSAKNQIARLRRQVKPSSSWRRWVSWLLPILGSEEQRLTEILEHAAGLATHYSGTIFACGRVGGPVQYHANQDKLAHFEGRTFAQIDDVHVFTHPLSHDDFSDSVRIRRQATFTPLGRQEFDGIKRRLSERNELPPFLREVRQGDVGFLHVNQTNWPSISCTSGARFIHEAQLRACWLDYLLSELKDERTPLLEECTCYRNGQMTGAADYFVKIHGVWLPVEAKLSVSSEQDLPSQLAKYIHVDSLRPTKGKHRDRNYHVQDSPFCLVADQSGVYLTSDGQFQDCSPGAPIWKRTELGHETVQTIREYLQPFITDIDEAEHKDGNERV